MKSTTNKKAMRKLLNAMRDLTLMQLSSTPKTKAQKTAIAAAIQALQDEYLAISGLKADATYREITAQIQNATVDLKQIIADRKKLQSTLVSAAKILGSISSVLALI